MKAFIRSRAERMPEGVYHRTLKAEAEVIDGDVGNLLYDLAIHRYILQRVVDALWDLEEIPEKDQAHQMFYGMLRVYGFRAHAARNIYNTAIALVKSVKSNEGSKPTIKKLSTRPSRC